MVIPEDRWLVSAWHMSLCKRKAETVHEWIYFPGTILLYGKHIELYLLHWFYMELNKYLSIIEI